LDQSLPTALDRDRTDSDFAMAPNKYLSSSLPVYHPLFLIAFSAAVVFPYLTAYAKSSVTVWGVVWGCTLQVVIEKWRS
jgi:hypothetical protein